MIYEKNNINPAFKYEGLARAAFNNCGKYGDPWGYAAQDVFSNFVPEPNQRGRRALSTIIIKIIIDNSDKKETEDLKKLEEQVWSATNQRQIIDIIDNAIKVAECMGY